MARQFTADIQAYRALTEKNMLYVASQAIQDVVKAAQTPQVAISSGATSFVEGKIPVDTSELTNSLTSNGTNGATSYTAAIAGMQIADTIRFEWTAPYALRIENGFVGTDSAGRTYNQAGRYFVLRNAERFSEFVQDRINEVKT